MSFDEDVFLWALTSRPEDARRFSQIFKPDWLHKTQLIPVLSEIYAFTRKEGEPPSVNTLKKIFEDKDAAAYKLRYKATLERVGNLEPDRSEVLYTLGQVKDAAVVRSLLEMTGDQSFMKKQANLDGAGLLTDVQRWITQFANTSEDRTMDIRESIEHLVNSHGFSQKTVRIPTGISVIDEWTQGGLRPKQLGLLMAPTGHGKTATMTVMSHKMAAIEEQRVWAITNELSLEEWTERFLARITGTELDKILEDPVVAYKNLDRHWHSENGLHKKLRLTEVTREISTDDLEAEMSKWANLTGWKPDVIVLDYMERMKPAGSGYSRDKEWIWLQAIARDLIQFAKRHNILVWTAIQTNREGLTANSLDMSQGQGSIRHFQEATAVIGLHQIEGHTETEEQVLIQFWNMKQRQSRKPTKPVTLLADLGKMNITSTVVVQPTTKPEEDDEDDTPAFDNTPAGAGIAAATPRQKQMKNQKGKKWQSKNGR